MMQTLIQDIRSGVRLLIKRPSFTAVAVLTLALGIGANTVIFSVINAVLLRPLPFPEAGRIIRIQETHADPQFPISNLTYATFLDLGADSEAMENIAAVRFWTDNLSDGGEPEQVATMMISHRFFSTLR